MNLAEKLSRYARKLCYHDLPGGIVHEVKRRLLDSLGCALGALSCEPARIILRTLAGASQPRGATLIGTAVRTQPESASFYNGTLVRYLDYNDTYLSREPAHPSDNIAPLLAVSEAQHRSGTDLITAIALAYEVQCRLCDAASLRSRGWDHVTYGVFSTALAGAKLLGASENTMVHALGLAAVANVALRQTRVGELSMWKGCAFANTARNGLFAARLAHGGLTGPRPIFEGDMGFCKLVSGPLRIARLGGPSAAFKIMSTSIKFFPAEYHAQGPIEAALALHKTLSRVEDIRSVTVWTFLAAVEIIGGEAEKWHPVSRETADHSLPYCVAAALTDGGVGLDQFKPERIRDRRLHRLMQRIRVKEDPALTALYPRSNPVRICIEMSDGRRLEKHLVNPKGHCSRPLTDVEVEEKFRALAEGKLSKRRQDELIDKIWSLEKISNVETLMKLLR